MPGFRLLVLLTLSLVVLSAGGQEARQKGDQSKPLSPADELATFRLDPGFTIELVAAEPQVVDPVAFCFDARGDLYVVEMRGYPNGGVGEGKPNLAGQIKKLEDCDGDGYYETATVFLDNLRFPCAMTPWRNGFLIGDAPDLLFAADTDGDGKADVRRVLYTGFGTKNIQQMINSLQFHFDNWVYGCNGGNDSPVRSVERPDAPPVQLRGMHFRFKPDAPGSLEACSGGGQYGLTATAAGDWLTCTNSQHIRHIVLPDQYLKRNPYLAVPAVTLDIADHGAACKVFRISPFEKWRVERTTRRAGSEDAKRFPTTELVPGGYVTSGCSICVWHGRSSPARTMDDLGHVFVCDPANNLVHRDVLVPSGSTYRAERHDPDREFLASTDTWFRPTFLANGPGEEMYLADFYREIIETPLSLPQDIKARWNLNSRARGRIWRILSRTAPPFERRALADLSAQELANLVTSPLEATWAGVTAQRLLLERPPDPAAVARLRSIADAHDPGSLPLPSVRVRALWLLNAWGELTPTHLQYALESKQPVVMIQALRLAEQLKTVDPHLVNQILGLVNHADGHVRFQLSLSLGSLSVLAGERVKALLLLATQPDADSWRHTAILSSARGVEQELLLAALAEKRVPVTFLAQLATIAGKAVPAEKLAADATLREFLHRDWNERELAVLRGLGREYVRRQPGFAGRVLEQIQRSSTDAQRVARMSLLALVNYQAAEPMLKTYLQPQQPPELQQAALHALAGHADRGVPTLILANWPGWGPQVRREAQEVLFSRGLYLELVLRAAEQGSFSLRQLDSTRREQLSRHTNAKLRDTAKRLLAEQAASSRGEVLKRYAVALTLPADGARGKALFAKHCATCHQFDGQGHAVGPDLHSALGNKTRDALLIDLLDPNREVDSRYVNYVVTTTTGRTLTGMIASESAQSVTLRRAEGAEETILRRDIEEILGTGKSLMPENLEEQLTHQDVADVLVYLLAARSRK